MQSEAPEGAMGPAEGEGAIVPIALLAMGLKCGIVQLRAVSTVVNIMLI